MTTPRILILGLGSIGGLIAARIMRVGYTPTLVTNNPDITTAINQNGIRIISADDDFTVQAHAYTSLDEVTDQDPYDFVFLVMRAYAVQDAVKASLPLLKPDGHLVSFQNGIVEDTITAVADVDRLISTCVWIGVTTESPGVFRVTAQRGFITGRPDGQITPAVEQLQTTLQPVANTEISTNIRGVLWEKTLFNSIANSLATLAGGTLGEAFANQKHRHLHFTAFREIYLTTQALNISLYDGDDGASDNLDETIKRQYEKNVAQGIQQLSKIKPSMLQTLQRGRKTENDFLNGYIVRKAQEVGVVVPLNTAMAQMISDIENGNRQPQMSNLDELLGVIRS